MRMLRTALALCCAGSMLAPAVVEAAGTVTANTSGTEIDITFDAAAGVANDLTVTTAPGSVTVTDAADTITVAPGSGGVCPAGSGTNTVTCTNPNIVDATARLEDQSDRLRGSGTLPLFAIGGSGNDDITATTTSGSDPAGRGAAVIGEDGNDTLVTGDGNDNAEGGPGTDTISTGNGDDFGSGQEGDGDRVDLGAGEDSANVHAGDGAGDVHNGGPGLDRLSMGPTTFPPPPIDIVVDLEAGTVGGTNVGAGTVSGFEDASLFGHLTTRVRGTPGQNVIDTRQGADIVDPGAGSDFIDLSAGNDRALVRDGFPDVVRCGSGSDSAEVDPLDTTTDCEVVDVAAVAIAGVPTGPPDCRFASFRARLTRAALLKRGLGIRVRCATGAALEVRLLARAKRRGKGVGVARAGDLVVAERSLPVAAGTRAVRLRVARRLRAAVPRSTRLRLVVVARDEFGNLKRLTRRVTVTAPKRTRKA